jgi:hypothetical protein
MKSGHATNSLTSELPGASFPRKFHAMVRIRGVSPPYMSVWLAAGTTRCVLRSKSSAQAMLQVKATAMLDHVSIGVRELADCDTAR